MTSYILIIKGNQESALGNPIGYYSMTHRGKWVDKRAIRYLAWKRFVVHCWIMKFGNLPKFKPGAEIRLNVHCSFKNERHFDPENVRKGISDALFKNDKHVWGTVTFNHSEPAGVRIEICE